MADKYRNTYHVAVIGAGIGGLSAAYTLAGQGLNIVLIDENPHMGGQFLRQHFRPESLVTGGTAPGSRSRLLDRIFSDPMVPAGTSLAEAVSVPGSGVDILHPAQVLGIFPDRRIWIMTGPAGGPAAGPDARLMEIQAEILIFATGAREQYLPFKGWTLPGVMSLGAAQILVKSHRILPGACTAIAGTSPLMMALAHDLLKHRGQVAILADGHSLLWKLAQLPFFARHGSKLIQGARYTARLLRHRVTVLHGHHIRKAQGQERVSGAVFARTGPDGRFLEGTDRFWQVDSLAVGHGFVPNIELPVQAGCRVIHDPDLGGWAAAVNADMQTSAKGIYAVGETAGIGGAEQSLVQGEIAGMAILEQLGRIQPRQPRWDRFVKTRHQLYHRADTCRSYGALLNRICRVPAAAYRHIPDDTVICRCENITMHTIRQAVRNGFSSWSSLKKATRCGMGRCQARICGPVIEKILKALTGTEPETIGPPVSRAPVKNLPVRLLMPSVDNQDNPPAQEKHP
ncbi:MAG: NAD(P)/FAD-dependent oxidoreductase [Desulfotignum sp.]|nr:NAD(P)/FAD-dependent oxidoreductase [Desulfotignum sp.]